MLLTWKKCWQVLKWSWLCYVYGKLQNQHWLPPSRNLFFFFLIVLFAFSGRGHHGEAVLQLAFAWKACDVKWGELSKLPKAVLESELKKAIQEVFPGAVLTNPLDVVFKYWEKVARWGILPHEFTAAMLVFWHIRASLRTPCVKIAPWPRW